MNNLEQYFNDEEMFVEELTEMTKNNEIEWKDLNVKSAFFNFHNKAECEISGLKIILDDTLKGCRAWGVMNITLIVQNICGDELFSTHLKMEGTEDNNLTEIIEGNIKLS